ncbi:MAG: NAD(+) synthase [Ruminococcaceae bacterium]|nr:NAD(+) synthase [Oscillospiraceae bacterium]
MNFGFVKTAAVTPKLRVADCKYNAEEIINCANDAAQKGAELIVFPELCVTGYTCGDLFFQKTLIDGAYNAVCKISDATKKLNALIIIGAPLLHKNKLYNCAVVLYKGAALGCVPKPFLPNYSEFYEKRHFTPAPTQNDTISICGKDVVFGTKQLFKCSEMSSFTLGVEICEDLWAPLPPSTMHALAGATVIANLSASDEVIGKADYRRQLVSGQSARLICGYIYCDAGHGESTTDMVFAGHDLIAENGALLAESKLFEGGCILTDIDTEKLVSERAKNTSFAEADESGYFVSTFSMMKKSAVMTRKYTQTPFVPSDMAQRAARCESILSMQADGLQKRMEHTNCATAVLGISGGLDSSLALLVAVRAFANMGKPAKDIIAITMPCFGTTQRTKSNAEKLCEALGVTLEHVDITETVKSNFKDIGQSADVHDVTFENVQARVRTLVLMNTANRLGGLVIGTGDLSELALGWATYNGDHMSMYGVNCSVPKTLIRHLVAYCADTASDEKLTHVLRDILDTPVSPELLPAKNGVISQQTEEIVGPYELHDFFLYYAIRWAFSPKKVYFIACDAFDGIYDSAVILKWLKKFYWRFFSQQFKRSCLPDGPKVGSVTLSPRGDWRMPSDASAELWVRELEEI